MKILPNGQIKIEPGDTLYNIYGPNWKQLSGYTGDPTKLQAGTILPAPPNLQSTVTTTTALPPAVTSAQQAQQAELAKLKQQLEEATGKLEKAKVWLSSYPGATSTSQIPDWVLNAQSPEEVKSLITPKRIEELETTAFQMPQKSFQDIWNENYQASKLPELEQQIADIKSKLYAAEGQINENPWLSEASRVGRVKRLYELAQKDISNLTDQYNAELEKVKMLTDAAYKEAQTKQALQQQELNYLVKKNVPEALWPENSPETYKEWVLAGGEKGTGKSYVEYVKEKTAKQVTLPSSYVEWQLAGGQKGTGKTYAEWLQSGSTTKTTQILTQDKLNRLAIEGVPSAVALDIQSALNAGYTIDQIKKGIEQSGGNPAIVDTFVKVMKSTPTFTLVQP